MKMDQMKGTPVICIDAHEFVFAVLGFMVMITILIIIGGKW